MREPGSGVGISGVGYRGGPLPHRRIRCRVSDSEFRFQRYGFGFRVSDGFRVPGFRGEGCVNPPPGVGYRFQV